MSRFGSIRSARRIATVAAMVAGLGVAGTLVGSPPALAIPPRPAAAAEPSSSGPAWLAEINRYRTAAGLSPVTDNPAWDLGIKHHLAYLQRTPAGYFTGQYASAHTENPASPYYTPDGAQEAGYSDLALGGVSTALGAVDGWLEGPFHAVGMLRAQLTQVALAGDWKTGYAGLDVIHGLNYNLAPATGPILFPGPGVTTNLLTNGSGELPSPLQTCHWSSAHPHGLPLILLLTQPPASGLQATLTGPGASESTSNGNLCVVDANSYYSSDPVYGPTGLSILQSDNAVFLIPRRPLVSGQFAVSVQQPGRPTIAWSFSALAPVTRTSIESLDVQEHSVQVEITAPAGTRLRCALARRTDHGFGANHFTSCSPTVIYPHLRRGEYRLTVNSAAGRAIRRFVVD